MLYSSSSSTSKNSSQEKSSSRNTGVVYDLDSDDSEEDIKLRGIQSSKK